MWTVNRSPPLRGGPRGFDGGKHVKGRKRHILVDTLGLLWAVLVTPANVQDKTGLRWLLEEWGPFLRRLRVLWADGAYLSESLAAWLLARFGWELVVTHPPIASRGFAVAPKRWMVERTFAWLVHHRPPPGGLRGHHPSLHHLHSYCHAPPHPPPPSPPDSLRNSH